MCWNEGNLHHISLSLLCCVPKHKDKHNHVAWLVCAGMECAGMDGICIPCQSVFVVFCAKAQRTSTNRTKRNAIYAPVGEEKVVRGGEGDNGVRVPLLDGHTIDGGRASVGGAAVNLQRRHLVDLTSVGVNQPVCCVWCVWVGVTNVCFPFAKRPQYMWLCK